MLTVVNLPYFLSGTPTERHDKDLFIVTNFNKMFRVFRVHKVVVSAASPGPISQAGPGNLR